jgi:serine/threonine protein kinase
MCILGAVFVDHVVIQELTDFIWIGGQPYNDNKLKSVTRVLAALGKGITELEKFYKELSIHAPQDSQRFFPFIRQYPVGDRIVRFSYQAYLVQKTAESPSKAIFLATTEIEDGGDSRREIVVKFVQRYNPEAHRLLAIVGRAPELLYCSKEDPHPPELAGLIMVVMGYVSGQTAHQKYCNQHLPRPIFEQVEEAISILHAKNIVFADLRHPNIMITKDERVLLIDFDWCGVHEEDTYPVSLNDARNTTNSINWHPDVKRGGRMAKEHDTFRLARIKPQS